jgi:DNA-binding PadR family transcriptional regulator
MAFFLFFSSYPISLIFLWHISRLPWRRYYKVTIKGRVALEEAAPKIKELVDEVFESDLAATRL